MKKSFLLVLAMCAATFVFSQTKVLVLGTYHMGNPGLDEYNMNADDVLVPKRQQEIEAFTNLLATFKPTKICVEYPVSKQDKLNQLDADYVKGTSTPKRDETEQIGFRLAKKLNHQQVYALDAKAPFDLDTVVKVAQKYQFTQFLQKLGEMPAFMESENKKMCESTVTGFFQHINDPSYVRTAHDLYLGIAQIGVGDNYVGADLVADWYKRNLRIYSNLTKIEMKPEDRVLILYGAGHSKILQDLIDDSAQFELVQLNSLR